MKRMHLQLKTINSKLKQINGFIWEEPKKMKRELYCKFWYTF